MKIRLFCLLVFTLLSFPSLGAEYIHPECLKAFKKEGAKPGESSCMWKCQIKANLYIKDTWILCGGYCDKFCDAEKEKSVSSLLVDLYPGLTDDERDLAKKDPVKALKAFQLSLSADSICLSLYESSSTNDESDACRHFVWSVLLVNELGVDFAEKVLDAHENNSLQPKDEEKMDRANNKIGIAEGKKIKGELKESVIIDSFNKNLKSGKFIILKKK